MIIHEVVVGFRSTLNHIYYKLPTRLLIKLDISLSRVYEMIQRDFTLITALEQQNSSQTWNVM